MGFHISDEILATRWILQKDRVAAMELHDRHHGAATAVAWRILRTPNDIDDVVQDSFVEAFNHLHVWNTRLSFRGWLCGIVRLNCLDRLKKKRSEEEHFRALKYVRRAFLPPDPFPDDACEFHSPRWFNPEVRRLLRRALERMGRERVRYIVDPPPGPLSEVIRGRQTRDREKIAGPLLIDAEGRELSRRVTNELLLASHCGKLPGGLIQ